MATEAADDKLVVDLMALADAWDLLEWRWHHGQAGLAAHEHAGPGVGAVKLNLSGAVGDAVGEDRLAGMQPLELLVDHVRRWLLPGLDRVLERHDREHYAASR